VTRRGFLKRVAEAGSVSLAYEAMTGLGLLAAPSQAPFNLSGRVPGNVRVVILGAGLAGMTIAYELGKVGVDCRLLEARARPGGRCFTVRRDTVSEEEDPGGSSASSGPGQVAAFDRGLYFNAGPMRISHHHLATLSYCRELQVATEVFVPDCETAYLAQTRGPLAGKRLRLREARADFDGHIAELLSKALSQSQLDQPLTAEDRDRVLAYLRGLGALDEKRQYRGSMRRGVDAEGRRTEPVPLHDLFGGVPPFYVQTDYSSQPTMMQVAGGMDRLPAAFAAKLAKQITYRAEVREIRQSEKGVWVVYADAAGKMQRVDADYCVSTIPLTVLSDSSIQKDLSQPVQAAIAAAKYDGAGKIGLQFKRRFWEEDDQIYGGRSWTDQEVGQFIYPSHGFTTAKGVLVGYYLDFRGTMRARPPAEIQRLALEHGASIHPQYAREFETAFSVTWPRVKWSRGSWRSEFVEAREIRAALGQPDRRVYFAGDYMTDMSSWMQGAFESARETTTALHKRVLSGA
jgi:monoamine oxidase